VLICNYLSPTNNLASIANMAYSEVERIEAKVNSKTKGLTKAEEKKSAAR
jgi:hypothetical protein